MQHSSLSPEIGRDPWSVQVQKLLELLGYRIAKTTFCAGFPHARPELAAAMHACFLRPRLGGCRLLKNLLSLARRASKI